MHRDGPIDIRTGGSRGIASAEGGRTEALRFQHCILLKAAEICIMVVEWIWVFLFSLVHVGGSYNVRVGVHSGVT